MKNLPADQKRRHNNTELDKFLPVLTQEWERMNSVQISEYQDKLEKTCKNAVEMLDNLITEGTMALDLEQAVSSVKVLTEAQRDLLESKRKLLETMIRSAVLVETLKPPEKTSNVSLLEDYIGNNPRRISDTRGNSIFGAIDESGKHD